jgi:hypothetical protein
MRLLQGPELLPQKTVRRWSNYRGASSFAQFRPFAVLDKSVRLYRRASELSRAGSDQRGRRRQ